MPRVNSVASNEYSVASNECRKSEVSQVRSVTRMSGCVHSLERHSRSTINTFSIFRIHHLGHESRFAGLGCSQHYHCLVTCNMARLQISGLKGDCEREILAANQPGEIFKR